MSHSHSHGPDSDGHSHSHGPHDSHGHSHHHHHDHDVDDDGDACFHSSSSSSSSSGHGHSHGPNAPEHFHPSAPGTYDDREPFNSLTSTRNYTERAFTVGIGGPVGSGKTALVLSLCKYLRDKYKLVVVTNDIFTKEDCEFLVKHEALGSGQNGRIRAIETGGCPHAAIREDCSANLIALEQLSAKYSPVDLALVESGGDNLAANYSRELADYIIYVIDVAGGDKVPRKGGPGITQSDLLVINKTDLAGMVGADLELMERQAKEMRRGVKLVSEVERKNVAAIRAAAAAEAQSSSASPSSSSSSSDSSESSHGPIVLAQVKHMVGVEQIANYILEAWATAKKLQNRYKEGITI